ncbi:dihydropteroate synthase [Paraflavisolibacter sp. H34]|uniref:dihydropteroate synthase n=1 Tax=Huijunlia imazamoxiresistens TaxID=3127457 RepID=UPI0030179059
MKSLNCNGRLLVMDEPLVMGIINTTPDSFFAGSRVSQTDALLFRAEEMIRDGAALLDIGGQSTRPNSQRVAMEEELARVLPAVEALHRRFPETPLSIDTYYARVARETVQAGASIINDVTAGGIDPELIPTVAELQVPYVLMHIQGTLENMQQNPVYQNVVTEVFDALNEKMAGLHQAGINDIIIDPGFGFGKTIAHNFQLLSGLRYFEQLNKPLLVGLSRKGTVYKTLGVTAEEALNGTTVVNTISLLHGAHLLRVHDVKEAVQAIRLVQALRQSDNSRVQNI